MRLFRNAFPHVTKAEFERLSEATKSYSEFAKFRATEFWHHPFAIETSTRTELRISADIARLHLAHASYGRKGGYYSMAAYYSYLSAEEVSKGIDVLASGRPRRSHSGHNQGGKPYKQLEKEEVQTMLRAFTPFLKSTPYQTALVRFENVPEIIRFYDDTSRGRGTEMSAEFLHSTSNAFWDFGERIAEIQLSQDELNSILIELKKINAPSMFSIDYVLRIQQVVIRHIRLVADRSYLMFVLQPHKNAARYVDNGISPLSYVKNGSPDSGSIGLLDQFDSIWKLQRRFIDDLRFATEFGAEDCVVGRS